MKVMIFAAARPEELQSQVQAWLQTNPGVTVIVATQSSHPFYGIPREITEHTLVLTIYYTEQAAPRDQQI